MILAVVWFLFLRSPIPDISPEQAAELQTAADSLYPKWTGQAVPEGDWPPAIRSLRPKSVRVAPEGVYLLKEKQGAGERGVFIHLSVSSTHPTPGGDPSYRLIRESVYWYEIKG